MPNNPINALYIHIPFCSCICTYCDFYKMKAKNELKQKYINYLVKELYMKEQYLSNIKTIYIGGGTPSSLPINLIDYLLYHITKKIAMKEVVEFTFEANPNDINLELINILKKYNVNRVSLGVQSFNNKKLLILGRNHTKKIAINAIKLLKKSKIKNINVDIIYGLSSDNWRLLRKDIDYAEDLNVKHISVYSLIVEEKTILKQKLEKGEISLMSPDNETKIYYKIFKQLKNNGFKQYEISNFSRKNWSSKHNLVYWNNEHYLGLGTAAAYYIDNVRYTNVMNLDKYFEGIDNNKLNYIEETTLDIDDMMEEEMLLGLRKSKGINIDNFQEKFNINIYEAYPVINKLLSEKLLILKQKQLFIPSKKMYISNEILVEFLR